MNIIDTLIFILNQKFLIPITSVNGRYNLKKDLGMNQWEQMEMLLYVENEFRIQIEDREIHSLQTIHDVVACVEKHIIFLK